MYDYSTWWKYIFLARNVMFDYKWSLHLIVIEIIEYHNFFSFLKRNILNFQGPCSNVSCENNGTCIVVGSSSTCECLPGFTGKSCNQGTRHCCLFNFQNGNVDKYLKLMPWNIIFLYLIFRIQTSTNVIWIRALRIPPVTTHWGLLNVSFAMHPLTIAQLVLMSNFSIRL